MGRRATNDSNKPTRRIICLRIIERNGANEETTVFEYPFPEIDTNQYIHNRKELENAIDALPIKDHEKLASKNRIGFALELWHPNNFYKIGMMDWKYL